MNNFDDKLLDILNNADYDCSILNVEIDKNIQDNLLVPFEMSEGVLKIAIADASKLGLMKNLKTMTQMEPELYASSISNIVKFIDRLKDLESKKISSSNVKIEKVKKKNEEELIEVGSEVIVFGNKLITEAINLGADYLVIGRPIIESKNPLATIKKINQSIQ